MFCYWVKSGYPSSGINPSSSRCFGSSSFVHLIENNGQAIAKMGSTTHRQTHYVNDILKTVLVQYLSLLLLLIPPALSYKEHNSL